MVIEQELLIFYSSCSSIYFSVLVIIFLIFTFFREVKKSPFGNDISLVSLASRNVMCINPAVKKLNSQVPTHISYLPT